MVGERLAYKVREEIREAQGMRLATEDDVIVVRLSAVTLSRFKNDESLSSIYDYVLTYSMSGIMGRGATNATFLDQGVAYTGAETVDQAAESLAAFIDSNLSSVQEEANGALDQMDASFGEWKKLLRL